MDKTWVRYDELKQAVTLVMVLTHYRVALKTIQPGILRGRCPLPMHGSDQSTHSFMVNLTKGTGGAWSCHSKSCVAARGHKGGNAIDLIGYMEGLSNFNEAAIRAQELFRVQSSPPGATPINGGRPVIAANTAPEKPLTKTRELVSKKDTGAGERGAVNLPLKFTLQGVDLTHPYLATRGITEETAQEFGVGYFPGRGSMTGRVVIPIHNLAGELVAYAGRALEDSADKYKFPPGFHKALELYNAHRVLAQTWPDEWAELVVVVEGFFDCMKLWHAGIPAVALMGSSPSETQAEIIRTRWYEAVLMFDGDDAGRLCTTHALATLGRHIWVRAALLDEGTQPDQLSPEQIHELLDSIL